MKRKQQMLMGLAATALLLPATLLAQPASANTWNRPVQRSWQMERPQHHFRPNNDQLSLEANAEAWTETLTEENLTEKSSASTGTATATSSAMVTSDSPYLSTSAQALAAAATNSQSANMYPIGQCTWGVKELAPWAHTYWGNGGDWAASAAADGFTIGTVPVVGAIAVWTDPYGGYGHVAYVTDVQSETSIQVLEANIGGNPNIANYRGFFNPTTTSEGVVSYIYPPANS